MQGRAPQDRRPMSRGNKLLILVSLLLIVGFAAISLYPALLSRQAQPTAAVITTPTMDPQATIATLDEALRSLTATPPATSAIFIVPEATPTPVPNFEMTPRPSDVPTLKTGSSGDDVRALQTRLIALGYLRQGANDGVYGKGTQNAVRAFQQANGLSVDGSAGPQTLQKLFSQDAVSKPQ
ncbi:MAG: peptidoglycan-binding protein [Christensenellales bacterium]